MRGATVKALPIVADQDRPLTPLTNGQIDGARSARHERNHRRLVSLARNPERAVPSVEADVADIGLARLADPETVEAEEHRKSRTLVTECSAMNRKRPSSVRSIPWPWLGCTFGRRTYWAGFEAIRPSMCAKRYRPHTVARRRSIVDAASPRCSM